MAPKNKFPDPPIEELIQPEAQAEVAFMLISPDLIDDPQQPIRTEMTPASVEDLVMSIKQVGVIEPLVVKLINKRYEVIAGHRRLYASKLAKLPEVPCYVRKANIEQTEMLKILENLYRADIKPADEAKHFSYLIDKQKMSPVKVAQMISKSLPYVMDRLAILNYPDFLKLALDNGEISFSVAREFARFDDLKQMNTAVFYAKRSGMTQEMARKWVTDFKRSQDTPSIQNVAGVGQYSDSQPIEHTATCVFCKQGLRLIEAEVVYMHTTCLNEVNTAPGAPENPGID